MNQAIQTQMVNFNVAKISSSTQSSAATKLSDATVKLSFSATPKLFSASIATGHFKKTRSLVIAAASKFDSDWDLKLYGRMPSMGWGAPIPVYDCLAELEIPQEDSPEITLQWSALHTGLEKHPASLYYKGKFWRIVQVLTMDEDCVHPSIVDLPVTVQLVDSTGNEYENVQFYPENGRFECICKPPSPCVALVDIDSIIFPFENPDF